jgi:hypothetical protein
MQRPWSRAITSIPRIGMAGSLVYDTGFPFRRK